jgi:hydroxyacylglutathione hydrolase
LEGRFAEYAGDVIEDERDLIIVGEGVHAHEARVRLARVGLDSVLGTLDQPAAALAQRPDLVDVSSRITAGQLAAALTEIPDLVVLDVRGPGERAQGAIEASLHIPLPQLRARISELSPARPVVTYCAGGYRSSIAARLLRVHGFDDVSDLIGGYQGWAAA